MERTLIELKTKNKQLTQSIEEAKEIIKEQKELLKLHITGHYIADLIINSERIIKKSERFIEAIT